MHEGEQKIPKKETERLKEEIRKLKAKLSELDKEYRASRKSLEESQRILRHMPGGQLIVHNGKITQMNLELLDMLGYSEEEITRINFASVFHLDCRDRVMKYYRKKISGKNSDDRLQATLLTKNGAARFCEIKMNKSRYNNRSTMLVNVGDLETCREEEKKKALAKKKEALYFMAKGMLKKFDHFLSKVNPQLVHLQATASKAEEKTRLETHDPDTSPVIVVKEEGERILSDLKALAKSEGEVMVESSDLGTAINEALETCGPVLNNSADLEGPKIALKKYLRNVSSVKGNHVEIRDAIACILMNACDALPEGGDIYLTAEEHSGFARIFVQDNGTGIGEMEREKIFDPFFTTKDSAREGMGLTRALATVEKYGGNIEVMSKEGHGSTFILKIPLAEKKNSIKMKRSGKSINQSNCLVILKEDLLGDILCGMIESKGGAVTKLSSCQDAIKLLKKRECDYAIIDYDMLVTDRTGLIGEIKKTGPHMPLVIVNAPTGMKPPLSIDVKKADRVFYRPLKVEKVIRSLSEFLTKWGG